MAGAGPQRIATLDLIRGVAVLGILAINIAGYAGPPSDVLGPVSHGTAPPVDAAIYAVWLVVFEGKMRALFSILFGASLELFVSRVEAAGRDGQALQLRRLLWLAGFGYLHWLLWWGDILFSYAAAGTAALALRQAPPRLLLAGAVLGFTLWQADGVLERLPLALAEAHVAAGTASPQEARRLAQAQAGDAAHTAEQLADTRRGLLPQITDKLEHDSFDPVWSAWSEIGEALPYMLIGIVLLRSGLFAGGWSSRALWLTAAAGLAAGLPPTVAFAWWAWVHHFPSAAMRLALGEALSFPHLLMALGYAALLVLASRRILGTALGQRIAAAGRMAFSNYLGTTLVMTALFYGWGLDLVGTVGTTMQVGLVLLAWAVMLVWSAPWLRRFNQGPLEWLWRSLVEFRIMPFRR